MARKNYARPRPAKPLDLTIKHPDAAGIDVGSTFHCVAVPPDRDAESVRIFKVYTPDLHAMIAWLTACRITTVAMEATGVYWVPLYELLLAAGFEVVVVNPLFIKRMRDEKTDIADSQLILQQHTYGQLPASFHPTLDISVVQAYWRQRERLVGQAADAIRLMQKALDLMNLHLHKAISDLSGVTGLRILRAIVDGARDPHVLACLKEPEIKCSSEELVKALTGTYRPEHCFALQVAMAQYDFAQQQILACDAELAAYLATLPDADPDPDPTPTGPTGRRPRRRRQGHQPTTFDLAGEVQRLTGRDWAGIPGLGPMTLMTGIAEVGLDLTRWPTERHFASWLGLCPNRKITGGRVLSSHTRKVDNRFSVALRRAAVSLKANTSALGAEYRILRSRLGKQKAVTAMAHKLAVLFYRLLRYGQTYVDAGQVEYEQRQRERTLKHLQKRAHALGLELVESTQAA